LGEPSGGIPQQEYVLDQIPDELYFEASDLSQPSSVIVANPMTGSYSIEIVGTSDGTYDLVAVCTSLSSITDAMILVDVPISSGETGIHAFRLTLSDAIRAETSLDSSQDPIDGATELKVGIARVFDSNTNTELAMPLGTYQAQLAYDGTCINILDIREAGSTISGIDIDNSA
jgi:hypothetical protein